MCVVVLNAMSDPHLRTRRRQFNLKFFLQIRAWRQMLRLRRETNGIGVLRDRNESVVGIISSLYLRRDPKAVAPIKAKLRTADLARIRVDFMQQVPPVAKAVEENPWANIGGHNQLNLAIGQFVRVVPAAV